MIRWSAATRPAHRMRPAVLAVVAWALGAATAVAVGLLALSSVGAGLFGPADPLARAADVDLAGSAPTATPSPSPSPFGPSPESERTLTSEGGTVVARCIDGNAYLVLWSPAQGFRAGDVRRGPAAIARVKFETGGREIKMQVFCDGGVAQSMVEDEWESPHR